MAKMRLPRRLKPLSFGASDRRTKRCRQPKSP
jgi:hypothetical protein